MYAKEALYVHNLEALKMKINDDDEDLQILDQPFQYFLEQAYP